MLLRWHTPLFSLVDLEFNYSVAHRISIPHKSTRLLQKAWLASRCICSNRTARTDKVLPAVLKKKNEEIRHISVLSKVQIRLTSRMRYKQFASISVSLLQPYLSHHDHADSKAQSADKQQEQFRSMTRVKERWVHVWYGCHQRFQHNKLWKKDQCFTCSSIFYTGEIWQSWAAAEC